tara:strand:+ start:277 stop:501 length:225 start_codon:yes stop_codon:yes gene_type:complete
MANQVISESAGWLTMQQAATYLGVSIRGLKYAVALKKQDKANHSLVLKSFGNRTLINKQSLDETDKIIINTPHH